MRLSCFTLFSIISSTLCAQNFSEETFAQRRALFASEVGTGVAFIPSVTKNGGLNKNFYYLTGIDKPGYLYVFDVRECGENGKLFTPEQVKELETLNIYQAPFLNADSILVYKRIVKDQEEIAIIREACRITAEGIKYMYHHMKPGMTEQDLFNLMKDKFTQEGGNGIAHQQLASGNLGTSVHAGITDKVPDVNEMIVVDIGALKDKYTADISVSFTLSGTFTKEQQTVYDIVYKALERGVKGMVMGNFLAQVERSAQQVIIDELYSLGLITDKESAWQRFFWIQHGFSHHIGLDIHDVWYDYLRMVPEERRVFIPGMILTFEPALYFPQGELDARPQRLARLVSEEEFMAFANQIRAIYTQYEGFAVRLEEDILIKDDGTNENLTKMSLTYQK